MWLQITRSRNRWKFYLKDGIMNLGGKDYVFQKANGDAEWWEFVQRRKLFFRNIIKLRSVTHCYQLRILSALGRKIQTYILVQQYGCSCSCVFNECLEDRLPNLLECIKSVLQVQCVGFKRQRKMMFSE